MFESGKKKRLLTGKQYNNMTELVEDHFDKSKTLEHPDGVIVWNYVSKLKKGNLIIKKLKGRSYSWNYERFPVPKEQQNVKNMELET
jgi:hypothetical protein